MIVLEFGFCHNEEHDYYGLLFKAVHNIEIYDSKDWSVARLVMNESDALTGVFEYPSVLDWDFVKSFELGSNPKDVFNMFGKDLLSRNHRCYLIASIYKGWFPFLESLFVEV